MGILALYIALTIIGYLTGSRCKKAGKIPGHIGMYQNIAITVLVFCMGSRIGANKQIAQSLDTIGLYAFIITIFIMGGSVAAVFCFRKLVGFNRYGQHVRKQEQKELSTGTHSLDTHSVDNHNEDATPASVEAGAQQSASAEAQQAVIKAEAVEQVTEQQSAPADKHFSVNTLTLLILGAVTLGILAGYFVLPEWFINISGTLLSVFLCMLLFFVGIDMGIDGTLVENFKSAGWRIICIPFVVMIGSVVGGAIGGLILPMSVQDGLCISGGFAWYSLAPVMLMDYSVKVSAMSFMHNVMRELISILVIPLVARRIGYIESISVAGSVAMDVCLPIVERSTNPNVAVYSFITGATVSASVPILTTLFMSL